MSLFFLMFCFYAFSYIFSGQGGFVVKAMPSEGQGEKSLSLSETYGFSNSSVCLQGLGIGSLDNTTYSVLPLDLLDCVDGSHNGEKYIAYTFYLKNTGTLPLDYSEKLLVQRASMNVESAVRVMVYRNGTAAIYAKSAAAGGAETYPENLCSFCASDCAFAVENKEFAPGEICKYTIVIWLEGEDPECTDDIRSGAMSMRMEFSVLN